MDKNQPGEAVSQGTGWFVASGIVVCNFHVIEGKAKVSILFPHGKKYPATVVLRAAPNVFIMKPEEVKELAHRGEKDGRVSYWLQPPSYDQDQFREAWDRIGTP